MTHPDCGTARLSTSPGEFPALSLVGLDHPGAPHDRRPSTTGRPRRTPRGIRAGPRMVRRGVPPPPRTGGPARILPGVAPPCPIPGVGEEIGLWDRGEQADPSALGGCGSIR